MNDFTLQELDEIKRCLRYMITGGLTPYSNLTIALNKKLQLMMDNYDDECVKCIFCKNPLNKDLICRNKGCDASTQHDNLGAYLGEY